MKTDRTAVYLATLGPIGYLRPAPGTWGSAAAAIVAPFVFTPLSPWLRGVALLLLTGVGILAAHRAEHSLQCRDPQAVVIDEFAGQLLVFLLVRDPNPLTIATGLALFRLFDIIKPWPVGASETWFSGGTGIMVDDLLAGVYALLALHLLLALF